MKAGPGELRWGLFVASPADDRTTHGGRRQRLRLNRFLHGHCADCALAEIFGLDAESVIVAGAVVFPSDCGGQFDQLRFAEFLAQAGEQRVRNFHGCTRHGIGIFEREALEFRKVEIGAIVGQIRNLFNANANLSADGRADVDSKGTSDERGDAKFRESFEPVANELGGSL